MIDKEKLPYRKCVGICLINEQKKAFVGQRLDSKNNAWQMPQGGVENNETHEQAAFRELEEEIGTSNIKIISESKKLYAYDLPDVLIPTFWNGKYRGQEQKWFLAKFLGDDSEINIKTEHAEFSKWQWVEPKEMPELIVPFKKDIYTHILDEFKQYL